MRYLGEVIFYDSRKAFGFIRELADNGCEQFFHLNSVQGRIKLNAGDIATFEVSKSLVKPGRTEATNITLVKRDSPAAAPASAAEGSGVPRVE